MKFYRMNISPIEYYKKDFKIDFWQAYNFIQFEKNSLECLVLKKIRQGLFKMKCHAPMMTE
jgi:hypothetical protein